MSRSAFLLGCVHWAREAAAAWTRAAVTPRFPATKVDARTAAWLPEVRPQALCRPLPPATACPSLSLRSPPPRTVHKMEAKARGAPAAASLCALRAAGLPQGPPTRSPRHAGNARSRRRDTRAGHSIFFLPYSAPPHVRSSSGSWARVPGGDDWPPAGTRTPAEGGPSARHALRPCRFSADDARGSSQSEPSAQMLLQSPDRFCFESPTPAGPWPMGGRSFFRRCSDERAS